MRGDSGRVFFIQAVFGEGNLQFLSFGLFLVPCQPNKEAKRGTKFFTFSPYKEVAKED